MARVGEGLVPSLPDDVALQCLLRVPPQWHAQMQSVSRGWRELVNSEEFYERRRKEGATGHCVCWLQALPAASESAHPRFGVSVLDERRAWARLPAIPGFESAGGVPLFCRFAAVRGHLVVLGGWCPSTMEELRSVYIFKFSSWAWRRGADMLATRSFFACSAVGDSVLIAGGHDADKAALRSADRYLLDRDRWEALPRMHAARDEPASVVIDGKLFVLSGYGTAAQGEFRRDAEVFDPARNAWAAIDPMWAVGSKSVTPTTVVTASRRLFAFHHSQLVCYDAHNRFWQPLDAIPEGTISAVVCAAAFGTSIVVTGPSIAEDGTHRVLVYRLPTAQGCRGRWETVPVDAGFQGIAHFACVVEV